MKSSTIEKKASALLKRHSLMETPVDIFSLVDDEGITLVIDEMEDDHSGFLLVENGRATIAINESHHPNRQRFTAAHELGHLTLHAKDEDRFFVDKAFNRGPSASQGTHREEIEANRFAAALLMPEKLVRKDVGDNEITDLDIYKLSLRYGVSEQAMTLRLVNLGIIEP